MIFGCLVDVDPFESSAKHQDIIPQRRIVRGTNTVSQLSLRSPLLKWNPPILESLSKGLPALKLFEVSQQ